MRGSWVVEYADGTVHPQYNEDGSENAFRSIDWSRVVRVGFASQFAAQHFDFGQPGPGTQVSLRSRNYQQFGGKFFMCFMVVTSREGEEVSADSTLRAFYWLPDGSTHDCPFFNCPHVDAYATRMLSPERPPLAQIHEVVSTEVGATLATE